MAMEMGMIMETEKIVKMEVETIKEVSNNKYGEFFMVAAYSLIDVNDKENFLLDIIAVDYL